MATIFHLLDEAEPFSEHSGGAISRWTANVLRQGKEVVVCQSFDSSWDFPEDRLFQLPYWKLTDHLHPVLYRSPFRVQKLYYLQILRPLIKRLKVGDVLYVHNRPEVAGAIAEYAHERGFHVVLHMHNSLLLDANHGQRAAMKNIPISFCSEYLRQESRAAWPEHMGLTQVIRNGADAAKFRVIERETNQIPVIVFTGRLVPYKGIHVLLSAMGLLRDYGVAVRCKIIGGAGFGTSRKTRYTRQLEAMLPDNTEILGYQSGAALADLMHRSDIFCCPSIWADPFPLAPLEGMACGMPVVASRVGGIPEALCYGGGLLVPPGNAEELAAALRRLVEDAPLRMEIGRMALHAFRKHFLWAHVHEQYHMFVKTITS